jgi:hypothetical protein
MASLMLLKLARGSSLEERTVYVRPSSEALLIFQLLRRERANRPLLHASSDHCFIVGALRAKRIVYLLLRILPSLLVVPSRGAAWFGPQLRTSNDHRFIVGVP